MLGREKYPSPKTELAFKRYWDLFIEDVSSRPNFNEHHLLQLELLCDLYLEYTRLTEVLEITGYTYTTTGQYGAQTKPQPEVQQLNNCRSSIEKYTKLLGITLKANPTPLQSEKEQENWE